MNNAHDSQTAPPCPLLYRSLITVEMLGIFYQAFDEAQVVHDTLEAALDNPAHYRMCRALVLGMGGQAARLNLLDDAFQAPTTDDGAKVARAVALLIAGDDDGRRLIENVLATSVEPEAREAANNVLSYLSTLGTH